MLGTVALRIAEKEEFKRVVYNGDALKKNDFILTLSMIDNINNKAEVRHCFKCGSESYDESYGGKAN